MMLPRFHVLLILAGLIQSLETANADVTAAYTLTEAAETATKVTSTLSLNLQATNGERLVFFGVDATTNDSLLTANRTDFTSFSFSNAAPLLNDWNQIPGASVGVGSLKSSVEFETLAPGLGSETYVQGELTVDLMGLDLAANPNGVRLAFLIRSVAVKRIRKFGCKDLVRIRELRELRLRM